MKAPKTKTVRPLITISAKNLGALALPDGCQRCFWLKLKLGYRLPFSFFPGIFSSIDMYTKRVVDGHFAAHGAPPPWLAELGDIVESVEPPHWKNFDHINEQYRIVVRGVPDAILLRRDRKLVIVDYKTARFTDVQDNLLPMYQVQLNVYAVIAEAQGMGSVDALALVYLEPMTEGAGLRRRCRAKGFDLRFTAHVLSVEIDRGMIEPLLSRTKELFEMATPPTGAPGCKDCERLCDLFRVLHLSPQLQPLEIGMQSVIHDRRSGRRNPILAGTPAASD